MVVVVVVVLTPEDGVEGGRITAGPREAADRRWSAEFGPSWLAYAF
jgi:hypothetical protein